MAIEPAMAGRPEALRGSRDPNNKAEHNAVHLDRAVLLLGMS
jgi:hypothetical protein